MAGNGGMGISESITLKLSRVRKGIGAGSSVSLLEHNVLREIGIYGYMPRRGEFFGNERIVQHAVAPINDLFSRALGAEDRTITVLAELAARGWIEDVSVYLGGSQPSMTPLWRLTSAGEFYYQRLPPYSHPFDILAYLPYRIRHFRSNPLSLVEWCWANYAADLRRARHGDPA